MVWFYPSSSLDFVASHLGFGLKAYFARFRGGGNFLPSLFSLFCNFYLCEHLEMMLKGFLMKMFWTFAFGYRGKQGWKRVLHFCLVPCLGGSVELFKNMWEWDFESCKYLKVYLYLDSFENGYYLNFIMENLL